MIWSSVPKTKTIQAIIYMTLCAIISALVNATIKHVSVHYHIGQILFLQNFLGFLLILLFIMITRKADRIKTYLYKHHLTRAFFGGLAVIGFIYGFKTMSIADSTALAMTSPLFMLLTSAVLLKEPPHPSFFWISLIGFAGVLSLTAPQGHSNLLSATIVLTAAFFAACGDCWVRRLGQTDNSQTICFYFTLHCAILSGFLAPIFWHTPNATDWLWFGLIGIGFGLSQLLLSAAFSQAPGYVVSPFGYTNLLIACLLDVIIWNSILTTYQIAGMIMITGSGLLIIRHQKIKGGENV